VEVIRTLAATLSACETARAGGRTVGLVPTMGAFHAGHASLMRRAREVCDAVVVSVFNRRPEDPADLAAYPRDGRDLARQTLGGRGVVPDVRRCTRPHPAVTVHPDLGSV
jgi:pantoate--beta-alanine ligase